MNEVTRLEEKYVLRAHLKVLMDGKFGQGKYKISVPKMTNLFHRQDKT
jgi:hypothetical protein